ncbi:MAG: hypothetical protein ACREVV_06840 [Steroidobacteraceae bacterium]
MKLKIALLIASATGLLGAGISGYADEARADRDHHEEGDHSDALRAKIGYEIAPVPLDLKGRDRFLVGLGSYLVNAVADCNGCHSAGPATQYARGGDPYFKGSPPQVVNQATYLGGGRDFGPLIPGLTPSIVSRNLTPDHTGRPEGGHTFAEFRQIMRTGVDLDHMHPNCSDPKVMASTSCFPVSLPFNGDLLQIMPWPDYQQMTGHELRAIYEYLSAIPCISGPATGVLHNECS